MLYGLLSTLYSYVKPEVAGGKPVIEVIVPFVPSEHVVLRVILAELKSFNKTKSDVEEDGVVPPEPQPKYPATFETNL